VITAAALPHVSVHAFHCATSAMPPLPNMKEALTTNQPHLLMFGTNSKEAEAMDMWAKLVDRLEMLLPVRGRCPGRRHSKQAASRYRALVAG
jgi:hypothetical protein